MKKTNPGGRPPKYSKKYCKMIIQWFDVPTSVQVIKKEVIKSNGTIEREYMNLPAKLPTLESFAYSIGVHDDTLENWSKATTKKGKLKYPEFFGAYMRAKQLQKEFLLANGLAGLSPPASFIFVTKNITDMKDKQEHDHTTKGQKINGINYIVPEKPKEDGDTDTA